MPCKVTWKDNELVWELSGDISTEEFHKINSDQYGDPRWDSLKYLIADFRNVKSIDLPDEEVMLIQAMDKAAALSNPYLKIASIANTEETRKTAEFYAEDSPWECGVFETVEDARSWLKSLK
jgi:hypothetical protein